MPTTGALSALPAIEPSNPASPKANTPPSPPQSQYPVCDGDAAAPVIGPARSTLSSEPKKAALPREYTPPLLDARTNPNVPPANHPSTCWSNAAAMTLWPVSLVWMSALVHMNVQLQMLATSWGSVWPLYEPVMATSSVAKASATSAVG